MNDGEFFGAGVIITVLVLLIWTAVFITSEHWQDTLCPIVLRESTDTLQILKEAPVCVTYMEESK